MASSSPSTIAKYPYPSEVNIKEFVNFKLSSNNYFMWKPRMIYLIETQGLLGFINGTVPMPPERMVVPVGSSFYGTRNVERPDYQAWQRSDELLRRWILGTLEQDVLALVEHLKTAEEMWIKLEERLTGCSDSDSDVECVNTEAETDLTPYLPLYKAAITGNWKSAIKIFIEKPDAIRAVITGISETTLIVAAQGKGNQFVKELIALLKPEHLAQPDSFGFTALHEVAKRGNIEAAKQLVLKNPTLPYLFDTSKLLPLHKAAKYGRKELVLYLLEVTKEEAVPELFKGTCGEELVHLLIRSGLYDIALSLVQKHPNLATESRALLFVANIPSAFLSGTHLNLWQRLIYTYIPVELEDLAHHQSGGDIENATQCLISVRQKLHAGFWKVFARVAHVKNIRDKKIMHHQAHQLVKHLCGEVAKLNYSKACSRFGKVLTSAASGGIHEIVEEILASYPSAVYFINKLGEMVFHLAAKHRRENVFNLIYQCREELRHRFLTIEDENENVCLHLAGNLGDEQKLSLRADAAGAALQMQRELHWFMEVEKHSPPDDKEAINSDKMTPAMLFTETHKDLVKEGEKWMKDTSSSCSIVAALIVTIVFAAAITVPGGNNGESGLPTFTKKKAFIFFAVSDALALFSSTSSVLMFLSILTSRYGESDFLYSLPKRLIIGLVTLFLSIISMMVAFGAILYLVFGHKKEWVLIPVVALSCIPVSLFASLQFPLLLDMIKSTYGPSMFGKQSDRLLL